MDVDTDVPMHDAVEDQLDSTLDEEAPGFDNGLASSSPGTSGTVSYTHLDVYKRQV